MSNNNTVRWHDMEYLKINGHTFVYRLSENDEILVIPPGEWVTKQRNVRKGREWVRESYRVNVAKPIPLSVLEKAGYVIEMPRVVRGVKYGS